MQRLRQAVRPKREIKSVFERMSRHAAKPLREALRVTEVASARDLRATRDRVPGRVRPFNLRRRSHRLTYRTKQEQKKVVRNEALNQRTNTSNGVRRLIDYLRVLAPTPLASSPSHRLQPEQRLETRRCREGGD